jgi:hypothetical protein
MRALRLARVVAEAEALRWRHLLRRQRTRVVLGAIAGIFGLACVAALHVAAGLALMRVLEPLYAVLVVAGVDLVIAAALGALAARDVPGAVEREALQLRETAQAEIVEAATATLVLAPVVRALGARKASGLALAAVLLRYLIRRR